MSIRYLKISGDTEKVSLDGKIIECRPAAQIKLCAPEDVFDCIETCRICGKII